MAIVPMLPNAKVSNVLHVFKPVFFISNVIGCTSLNIHLQFSWISSVHTVLTILIMVSISLYIMFGNDQSMIVEDSTSTNSLIDSLKVLCTASAASVCTIMNILKTMPLIGLIKRIEDFSMLVPLRSHSSHCMTLRSVCLSLLLIAAGVLEIIVEPDTFTPIQMMSFVEYYCTLLILFTEYQFAAFVRALEAMLKSVHVKMKKDKGKSLQMMQRSVRYVELLKKFSDDLQSIFGVQILAGVFSSFVVCLISSYFSMLYVIKWFTAGLEVLPTSTVLYSAWVLFIILKLFEVLSSTHDLRVRAERYVMDFDNIVLRDVNKNLKCDAVLQIYLEGRKEWIMFASDVVVLDFSLLTDMAAANTTFLVILLQFGLRPS